MQSKTYSKFLLLFFMLSAIPIALYPQFKPHIEANEETTTAHEVATLIDVHDAALAFSQGKRVVQPARTTPYASDIIRADDGMPFYINLSRLQTDLVRSNEEASVMQVLQSQHGLLRIENPGDELELTTVNTDAKGNKHFHYRQVYKGIPVYNGELIVHTRGDRIASLNGRWYETPDFELPETAWSEQQVQDAIRTEYQVRTLAPAELVLTGGAQVRTEQVIFMDGERPILAFHAQVHPHPGEHLQVIINAEDGSIVRSHSAICNLMAGHAYGSTTNETGVHGSSLEQVRDVTMGASFDGDVLTNAQDLGGTTRSIHCLQLGSDFFMIDISRPMYNSNLSDLPNEPAGAVWTVDGNGGSPQNQNFNISHVFSNNNTWSPLEVSAQFNGATAYEYFRHTFSRNSINGSGGTIISVIDVREANGTNMDNAFWNGYAMFYGNGNVAFTPLARALDVAGHEMSHGVIQNTANLEYMGQSGALNESFADIFGAMIDRDDWLMGEEVVNTQFFPSGALRDLSNPNNGGSDFGDNGWQPAHMNEYVDLPNTPQGDNGGVHVNSGIPNRAFFLFATEVGKDVAEEVYYAALDNYLVRSSQFVDARIAVINAAEDLHGSGSAVAQAAANAFAAVGLGSGNGGNYQEDLELNPGDAFMLISDNDLSDLYFVDPVGGSIIPLEVPPPLSKPSITDDGTAAVYVDQNQFLKAILFDWSGGSLDYEVVDIEGSPQPIWRNIVVSKDGARIAFLDDEFDNSLYVYDFGLQATQVFGLYNPTTGSGLPEAGGVEYADAMEWDYSGKRVVYDALNVIPGTFGDDIEYWDIGFITVWDRSAGTFASGQIQKLFSSLPENVNVGNPSLAKNSPHIIVFDYLEITEDIFGNPVENWAILASNTESGRVTLVFENDALGYPNYSGTDELIVFDTKDPLDVSKLIVGAIDVQPNDIMTPVEGTARVFINGARWGTWFFTGTRDLLSSNHGAFQIQELQAFPNPADDYVTINFGDQLSPDEVIKVFDITGKEVMSHQSQAGQTSVTIKVGLLGPGIYSFNTNSGGIFYNGRFLKK